MRRSRAANIAIFASGAGSNAQKIIQHFRNNKLATVAIVISDKPDAGVLQIAASNNIPSLILDKEKFFKGDAYVAELLALEIDLIVLAGFMRKIPVKLINAFEKRIVNIHPALLPKYGGKGMYGSFVHEAIISNKETESGITIHFVDEIYDNGEIIFQERCTVDNNDTAESLAEKIHKLEHAHYPKVIESLLIKLPVQ